MRTIENMVAHLEDELEFWIVTRDRDLGDDTPYAAIQRASWQKVGNAYVYYLPAEEENYKSIRNIIKNTPHNVVYLNSFFEPVFTIYPLLYRTFGNFKNKPFILAPRGEFANAALSIKPLKKAIYLKLCKLLGLVKNIQFQASSEFELNDIKSNLGIKKTLIKIAPDLPKKSKNSITSHYTTPAIKENLLRVVFLSRISPMKNLDFAIKVLMAVKCKIQFDIYGPKEDLTYWMQCEHLLEQCPKNIIYSYQGNVLPERVKETFSEYDLFLFPTRGENYGHVIAESLSAGTPILLSNKTPWRKLEENNLGWVLPIEHPELFSECIENFSLLTYEQRQEKRRQILIFAEQKLCAPESVDDNLQLFLSLVSKPDNSD